MGQLAPAIRRHRLQVILDWALALIGLGLAVWQIAPRIAEVDDVGASFGQLAWGWLVLAAVLSAASLLAYGDLNRQFLAVGKAPVSGATVQAVTIAGNAISLTVPATGGAIGAAYTLHALGERGVGLALSTWATGMAGILTGTVLFVLAPLGFVGVGLLSAPVGVGLSLLLVVLIAGAVTVLRRPRVRVRIARSAVTLARRVPVLRDRITTSPARAARRVSDWIARQAPSRRQWALAVGTALSTWVLDYLALAGCVAATAHTIPWPAVALGYLAVQASIILNLTPGGAGPAEAGLLAALVAGGVPTGQAAIAVVLYRVVSWIGPAVVGWVVFFALVSGHADLEGVRRWGHQHARHARGVVLTARTTRLGHVFAHRHRRR